MLWLGGSKGGRPSTWTGALGWQICAGKVDRTRLLAGAPDVQIQDAHLGPWGLPLPVVGWLMLVLVLELLQVEAKDSGNGETPQTWSLVFLLFPDILLAAFRDFDFLNILFSFTRVQLVAIDDCAAKLRPSAHQIIYLKLSPQRPEVFTS